MIKLLDNHPVVVDRYLASIIGLNEAIILQQVHYWLEINKKNKRNYHEERYWTYNTIKKWQEEFPFWSCETVKRTFKKLREANLIITGNFNVYQMDRTLWYTINYEELEQLCQNYQIIGSDRIEDDIQNEPMEADKKTSPLPENSTEISPEISNQSISQSIEKDVNNEISNTKIDRQIGNTARTDNFKVDFERIIEKCELNAIDIKYREAVTHAIRLILLDIDNSNTIRIGDNNIPVDVVKKDMEKLNYFIIDHAIHKFKRASEEIKIRNTIAYLKACIYNSIHEMEINVDSDLRYEGLID